MPFAIDDITEDLAQQLFPRQRRIRRWSDRKCCTVYSQNWQEQTPNLPRLSLHIVAEVDRLGNSMNMLSGAHKRQHYPG